MKENKSKEATTEERLDTLLNISHERYVGFRQAYNNLGDVRANVIEELKPLLEKSNSEDTKFKNLAKEHLKLNATYSTELSYVATKFLMVASVYLSVQDKGLPDMMLKDFEELKKEEYKNAFSIESGNFVRNSNVELPDIPQEDYDYLFDYLSRRFNSED